MSKRSERKARAQARNARRQAENAATIAEVLDPVEARRQAIRVSKSSKAEGERRRAMRLNVALAEPPPDATVAALIEQAEKQRQLAANLDEKAKLTGRPGVQARRDRRGYLEQARIHDRAAGEARERQLENWRRFLTQQEIEALAKARGEELMDQTTHVADWVRDEVTGAIVRDRRRMPTLTTETAVARRREYADAATRLRRFRCLNPEQIAAGVRLEADWSSAKLEPRMVANIFSVGGGSSDGVADMVIDARTRVHYALQALRLAGAEAERIIVAVVVEGQTALQAGSAAYRDGQKSSAHVSALLSAGLSLLENHYRLAVKHGAKDAARTRTKARYRGLSARTRASTS